MEFHEIISFVSNLGFSSAMCLYFMWFTNKRQKEQDDRYDKIIEKFEENNKNYLLALSDIKNAIKKS
jgi:hypothetical protein